MRYLFFLFCFVSLSFCADSRLQFFKKVDQVSINNITTDLNALQQVARSTLSFIRQHEHKNWFVPVNGSGMQKAGIILEDVKKTLSFIVWVIENDKGKEKQRMLDPEFLNTYFTFMRWLPDTKTAQERGVHLGDDNLRITKYLIYNVPGSYKKTKKFPHALYAVEEKNKHVLEKFTKQQVLRGALEKEKAEPLIWLSRNSIEEALMQGTIYVTMPDNKVRVFNVEHSNGKIYDQNIKDRKKQKRYWSFKEVNEILGWGPDAHQKIRIMPYVTFAGDVHFLGIGKIIVLKYYDPQIGKETMRLGVLADTGGAFENNLYQLDFFAGIFPDQRAFKNATKNIPTEAQAFFLVKKS